MHLFTFIVVYFFVASVQLLKIIDITSESDISNDINFMAKIFNFIFKDSRLLIVRRDKGCGKIRTMEHSNYRIF